MTKIRKDFIMANVGLLLGCVAGLFFCLGLSRIFPFASVAMLFFYIALLMMLPFWCVSYSRKDLKHISLHFAVLIALSVLGGTACFLVLWPVKKSLGTGGALCLALAFYTVWVIVGYKVRNKKFFEAFWFSIHSVNIVFLGIIA